ncbi:hypothetical protein [Mesorhizobium sp.]|uniref:hypothetical protein n=1 Tax=Mesorhizobium sp. TaxID=1871066 RepID=UPI00120DB66F|nr:hypothetical protein [Mesorhizobium sp.]TIM05488.1 MAG: hypothetical protein E5Y62_27230 [Mesorhizobium sp.]
MVDARSSFKPAPTIYYHRKGPDFREAESRSALHAVHGLQSAFSGSAEIAPSTTAAVAETNDGVHLAPPSTALRNALAECHRQSSSQLLVRGWKEKIHSFLPPYKLYGEMLAGGSAAVDHVLGDEFFLLNRARAPSREKVALIAITVFIKPSKEDQSACSDYACVLEHADHLHVPPGKLVEWLLTTTLSRCKRVIRAKRKAEKLARDGVPELVEPLAETAAVLLDAYSLDVTTQQTERGTDRLVKFNSLHGQVELTAPVANAAPLPKLLRQLADHLEKTPTSTGGQP